MQEIEIGRRKLIHFFSEYTAESIEADEKKGQLIKAFGATDWLDLIRMEGYTQNYDSVINMRRELDHCIRSFLDVEQVQACLASLNKKYEDDSKQFEILIDLIKNDNDKCLFNSWSGEQQKYFNDACRVLFEWSDFFFSYTNRNLPETNNDFREIIAHTFKESDFQRDKDDVNYLAKLIVRYLTRRNLKAFFDQDNIRCGDNFGERIFSHCRHCFVFIQLIEEAVFCKPQDGGKNWCHLEFREFEEWVEKFPGDFKRHFFILTHEPDIVFPDPPVKSYRKWQNKVESLNYVAIVHGLNNLELKKKLILLVEEINATKNKVIQGCLGDFFVT